MSAIDQETSFRVAGGYAPRPIEFLGVRDERGYRLKHYSITCGDRPLDHAEFERGMALASAALPSPAVTVTRPGLGVLIFHQGRGVLYLVIAWWGNENELPIRVFVREEGAGHAWRPAAGDESVCVWDLEVIEHERRAYIKRVLERPDAPDVEGYLGDGYARPV